MIIIIGLKQFQILNNQVNTVLLQVTKSNPKVTAMDVMDVDLTIIPAVWSIY